MLTANKRPKKRIIRSILKKIEKFIAIPILFRFSIAKVLVILENPPRFDSSKHPLTVSVSKPNVLLKIKARVKDLVRDGRQDIISPQNS